MNKTKVSWKVARKVLSEVAWRGLLLCMGPPFLIGLLISLFGLREVLSEAPPFLIVLFGMLWIAYLYWCWLAAVKDALDKSNLGAGENLQEVGLPTNEKAELVTTHRKWLGVERVHSLNGWRRLWVLSAVLWAIAVGIFAYKESPHPYTAHVAGCIFPSELFSITASKIVREELLIWRRELPPNLALDDDDQLKTPPRDLFTLDDTVGIPGWNGDRLGRPKWARTPYVKAYCKTLFARLEQSSRAVRLREESSSAIAKRRIDWFATYFFAWIIPTAGIYFLGIAIVWVTRGFRKGQ